MDAKIWADAPSKNEFTGNGIFVQMRLYTPKPAAGNYHMLTFSVRDPKTEPSASAAATTTSYDSVVCAVIYNGDSVIDDFTWECKDTYGTYL